MIIFQKN